MAEATEQPAQNNIADTTVTSDFTCPTCSGGFIEEIQDAPTSLEDPEHIAEAARFSELWGQRFLQNFAAHAHHHPHQNPSSSTSSSSIDDDEDPNPFNMMGPLFGSMATTRLRGGAAGGPRTHISVRRVNPSGAQVQIEGGNLHTVLEQLLVGLTGRGGAIMLGGPSGLTFGGLAGNPGDYVWGEGGLDAIITQLMNQLEGTGPPPASKEKIDTLPDVVVDSSQVDKGLQCYVCFDDLTIGESMKQLPCQHLYHKDCIVPWLLEHGTCPVCRKTLDGTDTTCDQNVQSIPETLETIGLNPNQETTAAATTASDATPTSIQSSSYSSNSSSPSNSTNDETAGNRSQAQQSSQRTTDYDDDLELE